MNSSIVASLAFDSPLAEEQWRKVLFGGVSKKAHAKRYADVITNIANHQDAFNEDDLTVIQPLGGNRWGILKISTILSSIKHTFVMSVRAFSTEVSNQGLMQATDQTMRGLLLDMQLDDPSVRARTKTKLLFVTGLIEIYDANAVTCGAGPKETSRISNCIQDLLVQIDLGYISADDAIVEFSRELARMHKAANRRANAS